MSEKTNVSDMAKTVNNAGLIELRKFANETAQAVKVAASASSHLLRAAIKSRVQFAATVEAFYGEIRADKGGIAVRLNAERNEKGDGYTVPSSIRAQVSQVLRAVKLGVELGTEEQPRSITDIRKDAQKAAETAAAAAAPAAPLTGEDAIRKTIADALADAAHQIIGTSGPTLEKLMQLTAEFSASVLSVLAEAKADDATAAKDEPEAAPATMPEAAAPAAAPRVTTKRSRKVA